MKLTQEQYRVQYRRQPPRSYGLTGILDKQFLCPNSIKHWHHTILLQIASVSVWCRDHQEQSREGGQEKSTYLNCENRVLLPNNIEWFDEVVESSTTAIADSEASNKLISGDSCGNDP